MAESKVTERSILELAMRIDAPQLRSDYLEQICAGDASLLERVEAQLQSASTRPADSPETDEATHDFSFASTADGNLEDTPQLGSTTTEDPLHAKPGRLIAGRYALLNQVGEGGMGSVWVAEQLHPVKRKVAIKLIKPGMDSRQVLARFEAERQALALMDHSNIAKVLDGGLTEQGRPFFAMEYVEGKPLIEYCDQAQHTVRERLELFITICHAVQHAHQKGVIHRDLKPSNILVGTENDRPAAKVIDFGLAKAIHAPLTEQTLQTANEALLGTPLYMSPEQVELNNVDIDTRTDVYALGVILYELLTGRTPIDRGDIKQAKLQEMIRLIKELDPPIPSDRLGRIEGGTTIAEQRGTELVQLRRALVGDLDWVAMKALSKERSRRYATASEFADDVRRHLDDMPVSAGPPSRRYRIGKFVKRNRLGVISATLILVTLVAGIVGTSAGLFRADIAKRKSDAAALSETQARLDAEKRTDQVLKSNRILGSILAGLDPQRVAEDPRPLQAILLEQLDEAIAQLTGESIGDPVVVAEMQAILGRTLLSLSDPAGAVDVLEEAKRTLASEYGPDDFRVLSIGNNLSWAYRLRGDLEMALSLLEESVPRSESVLGAEHVVTLNGMNQLAFCLEDKGELDRALAVRKRSYDLRREHFNDDHEYVLAGMNNLADTYMAVGDSQSAIPMFEETLEITREKYGPNHPFTLTTSGNLALALSEVGRHEEAATILAEVVRLRTLLLGEAHRDTLAAMNNLALTYQSDGKLTQAAELLEVVVEAAQTQFGIGHSETLRSMSTLAVTYQELGRGDEALILMENVLENQRASLGTDHPDTIFTMSTITGLYLSAGQHEKALPLIEDAYERQVALLGPTHPDTLQSLNNLAGTYSEAGDFDRALPLYDRLMVLTKQELGPRNRRTLIVMNNLANLYMNQGKPELALPILQDTYTIMSETLGAAHPNTLTILLNLSSANELCGKQSTANALLAQAIDGLKDSLGTNHPLYMTAFNNLAKRYWQAGRTDLSIPMYEESLERSEARFGRNHPSTLMIVANLGVNYKDAGRIDEGLPLLEEAHQAASRYPALQVVGHQLLHGYLMANMLDEADQLFPTVLSDLESAHPQDSTELAAAYAQLALVLIEAKSYAKAEQVLRECLSIRETHIPDSWLTFNTKSMLGAALAGQSQYAEAEPLLLEGYAGLKRLEQEILPAGKIRLIESLDHLQRLYDSTDRPAEAAKWRLESINMTLALGIISEPLPSRLPPRPPAR